MKPRFDVIVVGAGPAGLAAAYVLAKAGVAVVVIERGEYPGTKNMFGGVLYTKELNDLLPNVWEKAPVERHVTRRVLGFLTSDACLAMDFRDRRMAVPPYNGFTVLRSKFDRWFAGEARAAGALIVPETVVDDVLIEGEHVVGVKTRRSEGTLRASVVIAADGVNAFLAKKAGLHRGFAARDVAVGVKELLALPEQVIQERFGLTAREGAAHEYVGSATDGVQGGGFLYTNRESVSVGIVTQLESLKATGRKVTALLEAFKAHPAISDLLRDSTLLEYSAHLIPETGRHIMPKLYRSGMLVVGDAAAFTMNTGLNLEGANYAIASGIAAAETVREALDRGDFSARTLARYEERLKAGFVLKDFNTMKAAPDLLSTSRIYRQYPEMVIDVARQVFTVNGQPKQKLLSMGWRTARRHVSLKNLAVDAWKGVRSL